MKFCAACGAPQSGGRFCPNCGAPSAPVAPAAQLAPLRAAPPHRNWPAMITGLLALTLLAGGVTFLAMHNSSAPAEPTTTSVATTAPPASTLPNNIAATSLPLLDPAAQLAATRDADRPVVESLVGRWVPQLSAKREGLVADGITYTLADILALHGSLRAEYAALLVWSGDYAFDSGDLWVSVAPDGFATAQEALDWCVAKARDRDNCLARFVTHDPSASPTVQLQP